MISCADALPLTIDIARYFHSLSLVEGFDSSDPSFSPAQHRDLSGLPPAVVIAAAFDILRDQGMAYAQQLEEAGVSVISRVEAALPHSFLAMGSLSPEVSAACERVVADIATLLER